MALTKVTSALTDLDGGITIDNITIDGTEIDLSSGDLTIDVAGDIILDADGDNIFYKAGGSTFYSISNVSGDTYLGVEQSDKDLIIRGNDGGAIFSALTLDMSAGGTAQFAHDIEMVDNGLLRMGAGGDLILTSDGTHGTIFTNNGNFIVNCNNTIKLDADDGEVQFLDANTEVGIINMVSSNFGFESKVQDKDIIFKGNDGGSEITALTIDMSEAGAATFNNNVTAFSDERLKDNIETLEDGLDKVEQLRGVTLSLIHI